MTLAIYLGLRAHLRVIAVRALHAGGAGTGPVIDRGLLTRLRRIAARLDGDGREFAPEARAALATAPPSTDRGSKNLPRDIDRPRQNRPTSTAARRGRMRKHVLGPSQASKISKRRNHHYLGSRSGQIQPLRRSRLPPTDVREQNSRAIFGFSPRCGWRETGRFDQQRQMFRLRSSSISSLCCSALKVDIRSCSTCSAPESGESGRARGCRWPIGAGGIDAAAGRRRSAGVGADENGGSENRRGKNREDMDHSIECARGGSSRIRSIRHSKDMRDDASPQLNTNSFSASADHDC